jgi:hypothetical protein
VRAARFAALLLALPAAGCIFAVDNGGKSGLQKRVQKLEKRIQKLERDGAAQMQVRVIETPAAN